MKTGPGASPRGKESILGNLEQTGVREYSQEIIASVTNRIDRKPCWSDSQVGVFDEIQSAWFKRFLARR